MIKPTVLDRARLELAWGADTMMNPETYDRSKPSKNQCAVTALLVHDTIGAEIVRSVAQLPDGSTDSHYYTVFKGEVLDFTRDQFPDGTIIPPGEPRHPGFSTTREYLLSNPDTAGRYFILRKKYQFACDEIVGSPEEEAQAILPKSLLKG